MIIQRICKDLECTLTMRRDERRDAGSSDALKAVKRTRRDWVGGLIEGDSEKPMLE